MRRVGTILLLMAVAVVSSSPGWALALADHSCCVASAVAGKAEEQSRVAHGASSDDHASASKHDHCAAMSMRKSTAAESTAPGLAAWPESASAGQIMAQHSCKACAMEALTLPQAAPLPAQIQIVTQSQIAERAFVVLVKVSGVIDIRRDRGPPSFLN